MNKKLLTLAGLTGAALIGVSALVTAQPAPAMSDKDFERMYAEMDTNKDGRISRAEYANYHATRFDSWDTAHAGMTREQIRTKMFERELRKTDGNSQGNSPLSVQQK